MKDPHDIILRPVLTEKAYEGIGDKRYIFEVLLAPTRPRSSWRWRASSPRTA